MVTEPPIPRITRATVVAGLLVLERSRNSGHTTKTENLDIYTYKP